MPRSKIVYFGETLIDLTQDTVTADKLLAGMTAHGKDGEVITGECTFDSDTADATAAVAEILAGKTAYARGARLEGIMPNNGAANGTIAAKDGVFAIPQGYHDGSGKVQIDATEQEKIKPENIKSGVEVLGVTGSYGGEAAAVQSNKTVTPTSAQQTVLPDEGYDYLAQVTVAAIPYVESENSAGGITVTIGG